MRVEVLELRPVTRPGGLVFTATLRLGELVIRGWRGVLWDGELRVGVPQRAYWDAGQRFHEALLDVPPPILEEVTREVLAAWSRSRAEGNGENAGRSHASR